jgi:hypothetical protein
MNTKTIVSAAVAAEFGVIHFLLTPMAWRYIPNNPFTQWLFHTLPGTGWFYPIIRIQDLLISIVLALPLAAIIYYLRPKQYYLYLAIALLPSFLWNNSVWLGHPYFGDHWGSIVLGWGVELSSIPIALLLIHKIKRENPPLPRHQEPDPL